MVAKMNVVEFELKNKFDNALTSLYTLDEKLVDKICERFGIDTEKVEERSFYPDNVPVSGMTPAEVKKLLIAHINKIPKDFKTAQRLSNGFIRRTPIFKDKRAKVEALRQKIELNLLLNSAGKDKKFFEVLVDALRVIEAIKNDQNVPYFSGRRLY